MRDFDRQEREPRSPTRLAFNLWLSPGPGFHRERFERHGPRPKKRRTARPLLENDFNGAPPSLTSSIRLSSPSGRMEFGIPAARFRRPSPSENHSDPRRPKQREERDARIRFVSTMSPGIAPAEDPPPDLPPTRPFLGFAVLGEPAPFSLRGLPPSDEESRANEGAERHEPTGEPSELELVAPNEPFRALDVGSGCYPVWNQRPQRPKTVTTIEYLLAD